MALSPTEAACMARGPGVGFVWGAAKSHFLPHRIKHPSAPHEKKVCPLLHGFALHQVCTMIWSILIPSVDGEDASHDGLSWVQGPGRCS